MTQAAQPGLVARPVDVGAVERELTRLWSRPKPGPLSEEPVTRACMSNLIVYCANDADASFAQEEIADIVQRHPARVLLLVGSAGEQPSDLEAYVSAVCFTAGAGRQICSENVTISAHESARRRLPATARSLLIGDLPTALWWTPANPPPSGGELFGELAAMARHVIYDSEGWADPVRGVVSLAGWVAGAGSSAIVSDLAWRRLSPWRRLIGQALDPALEPGALDAIDEVEIEHGPHALPKAWLLIGWLAARLGWRPVGARVSPGDQIAWSFDSELGSVRVTARRQAQGDPVLRRTSIGWRGASGRVCTTFSLGRAGWIAVDRPGAFASQRILARGDLTRAALVTRQLPKLFRDPVFRDALAVSRAMAEALVR